jgi:mRNA degradation ribonuclease J1/J2
MITQLASGQHIDVPFEFHDEVAFASEAIFASEASFYNHLN